MSGKMSAAALVLVLVLSAPALALAMTFSGSQGNDYLYVGYCASCRDGAPGVLFCGKRNGTRFVETRTIAPTDRAIYVYGLGGNDWVQTVHNGEREGCSFGDYQKIQDNFDTVRLYGGDGNDCLYGTFGPQWLDGGEGDDALLGYTGDDILLGGNGADYLEGAGGVDIIYGQGGDDILVGGTGLDTISGGSGDDVHRCRESGSTSDCNDDTTFTPLVEKTDKRRPDEEWAFLTRCDNGVTMHHLTTNNAPLLLSERAAGATLLLGSGGDVPLAGDFDRDGRRDDVAVYRPTTQTWYYDFNHDRSTNRKVSGFGLARDRPLVGDFDRDGRMDDVAVFRASNRSWYYDFNHDGSTNAVSGPWGVSGDIPLVGDFDRDGYMDDVAIFRLSNKTWYFDYDHNGSTNATMGPWGSNGDIPLAGDFNRDGFVDDLAVFRPASGTWYFDYNHNGSTDKTRSSGGGHGEIPLAGDFDRDGFMDDVALFRLQDVTWRFDHDHDGSTNATMGPWGYAGAPRAVTHRQYKNSCGPSSLNIVMEHLGLSKPGVSAVGARDLDNTGTAYIDLGYHLSTEHLIYQGYARYRALGRDGYTAFKPGFITTGGVLDPTRVSPVVDLQINYPVAGFIPGSSGDASKVESWLYNGPGVGTDNPGVTSAGLPWVANQHPRGGVADAYPVSVTPGSNFASHAHLVATIKGFIDNNIPLVLGVERTGHFNTVVGYWVRGDGFWIYTAEPLDGWGRRHHDQPMRWRRLKLDADALPGGSGTVSGMMLFGQGTSCKDRSWAYKLDATYGRSTLCGHVR